MSLIKKIKAEKQHMDQLLKWFNSGEEFVIWTGKKFSYPIQAEQFYQNLNDPSTRPFAFFETNSVQNELIGYGEITRIDLGESASLSRIIIHKDFRKKGYGKKLVEELIKLAKEELHVKKITLNVFVDNLKAIQLYHDLGFSIVNDSHYEIESENKIMTGQVMSKVL